MSNYLMSFYREQLENWLKEIDVSADHVYDVGGIANPVSSRTKNWKVDHYRIIDNGLEGQEEDHYFHFDLQKGDWLRDGIYENADVAFCLEVFEYIFDPVSAMSNLRDMLKKGGLLYITFPFVYPIHEPKDYDCLRYTKSGVIKLLTSLRFEILEIKERIDRSGLLYSFYKADGMHPAKGENHDVTGWLVKAKAI